MACKTASKDKSAAVYHRNRWKPKRITRNSALDYIQLLYLKAIERKEQGKRIAKAY
jgi:hypothetical protein